MFTRKTETRNAAPRQAILESEKPNRSKKTKAIDPRAREARALRRLRSRRLCQFHGSFEFRFFAFDSEILVVKFRDFFHLIAAQARGFRCFRELNELRLLVNVRQRR